MCILVWGNSTCVFFFLKDMYFIAYLKNNFSEQCERNGVLSGFLPAFLQVQTDGCLLSTLSWFYYTVWEKDSILVICLWISGFTIPFIVKATLPCFVPWHLYECLVSICACITVYVLYSVLLDVCLPISSYCFDYYGFKEYFAITEYDASGFFFFLRIDYSSFLWTLYIRKLYSGKIILKTDKACLNLGLLMVIYIVRIVNSSVKTCVCFPFICIF